MKNIRTNRRKEGKRKNFRTFVAGITALSVVMGSSYFAFATETTYCDSDQYHIGKDHDDDCYEMIKLEEGECTGVGCYELTCKEVEHTHNDACMESMFSCDVTDEMMSHVCGETCEMVTIPCEDPTHACNSEAHPECADDCEGHHTDDCTQQVCSVVLALGDHGTEHDADCYTKNCAEANMPYGYSHKHVLSSCFKAKEDIVKAEPEGQSEEQPAVDPAGEPAPVNEGDPAPAPDKHTGDCYVANKTCDKIGRHDHTNRCYLDPETEGKEVDDLIDEINVLTAASDINAVLKIRAKIDTDLTERQRGTLKEESEEGTDYTYYEKLEILELNDDIAGLPDDATEALGSDLEKAKDLKDRVENDDEDNGLVLSSETVEKLIPNYAAILNTDMGEGDTPGDGETPAVNEVNTYKELLEEIEEVIEDIEEALDEDDETKQTNAYNAYFALSESQRELIPEAKINSLISELNDNIVRIPTVQVPGVNLRVYDFDYIDANNSNNKLAAAEYLFINVRGDGGYQKYPVDKTTGNQSRDNHEDSMPWGVGTGGIGWMAKDQTQPHLGKYLYPIMAPDLSTGGTPQAYIPNSESGAAYNVTKEVGNMDYLFGENSAFEKGAMENGGGLFKLNSEGDYIYNSWENAAYFNGSQFEVYNKTVMPYYSAARKEIKDADGNGTGKYEEGTGTKGNFLPFNAVNKNTVEALASDKYDSDYRLSAYVKDDNGNDTTTKNPVNVAVGMAMDMAFFMPEGGKLKNGNDMEFEFNGDDDVFIYIDGKLVLDIGGNHGAKSGTINFATGIVEDHPCLLHDGTKEAVGTFVDMDGNPIKGITGDGEAGGNCDCHECKVEATNSKGNTIVVSKEHPQEQRVRRSVERTRNLGDIFVDANGKPDESILQPVLDEDGNLTGSWTFKNFSDHKLQFFYMERCGNISNCYLRFNMPTLPAHALRVTKDVVENDITSKFVDDLEYKFRAVDVDTKEPLFKENTKYYVSEGGTEVGYGFVDKDGFFTLKDGQTASFPDMMNEIGNDVTYYVEEWIPEAAADDYNKVTSDGTPIDGVKEGNYVVYKMDGTLYTKDVMQSVTFTNEMNPEGKLSITKETTDDFSIFGPEEFTFKVKLNDKTIKEEISYAIYDGDKFVANDKTEAGGTVTIEAGQTAVITGIPAGTKYSVEENSTDGMNVTYSKVWTETVPNDDPTTPEVIETKDVTHSEIIPGDKATGTFAEAGDEIEILVENQSDEFEVEFTLVKSAQDVEAGAEYEFYFDIDATDATGAEFTDFKVFEVTKDTAGKVTDSDEIENKRVEVVVSRNDATCDVGNGNYDSTYCTPYKKHAEACVSVAGYACTCTPEMVEVEGAEPTEKHADDCQLVVKPDCTCEPQTVHMETCLTLPQVASARKDLVLAFDENTDAGTYSFKVTEFVPVPNADGDDEGGDYTQKFEYDKSVYVVTVVVDPSKDVRAEVTGVTKDGTPVDVNNPVKFENKTDGNHIITKVWMNDNEEIRPDSIEIIVYRDGVEFDRLTLTEDETVDGIWTKEINYIDPEDNFVWTIDEVEVGGRYVKSSVDQDTFTVTNTFVPKKDKDPDPTPTPDPEDKPKPDPKPNPKPEDGDVLGIGDENVPLAEPEEEIPLLAGVADTGDNKIVIGAAAVMAAAFAAILALRKKKED